MKNINRIIYLLLIAIVFSCDDYLDRAPDLNLDEEKIFNNYETAYKFQADIYSNLLKGFNVLGDFDPAPIACATDEAESRFGWNTSNSFNVGAYDNVDNQIARNYDGIRKANIFLSKKDVIPFPTQEIKNHLIGETLFLRAFFFHEIIKRYGGMPILNDILLSPNDNLNLPRNSYMECVNAILEDLKNAISLLPVTVDENDLGRVTRGAAMALKSRVLLYAASPLWDKENSDTKKWEKAYAAAKELIDLKDDSGNDVYKLLDRGKGAEDYEDVFLLRPNEGNTEVIFWYNSVPVGFTDSEIKVWAPAGENFGGIGAVSPTQNFVDMYEMDNGIPINEIGSGYDEQNPYENRDPRFYKTIIYNGSVWQGTTAELFVGGKHRSTKDKCRTGYYVRKYLPENVSEKSSNKSYHNWIYFRLAEIYLNYAEALNETLDKPSKEVYDAVNIIRSRSGMPDLPDNLTKDEMRKRIKNERAIELSFEEHRWWDVRRWKDGVKNFNGPMYEMEIIKQDDGSFIYNKVAFETRVFSEKMNLYPIPKAEMDKNPLYEQNEGWNNY